MRYSDRGEGVREAVLQSIVTAIAVMSLLSLVLMAATARLLRTKSTAWTVVVGFGSVGVLLLHALVLLDHLAVVRVLPVTDVMVWGNMAPLATAVLAGVVWAKGRGGRWRRLVPVVALVGLAWWRTYGWALEPLPKVGPEKWTGDVCRQTTRSTCTPAAIATLLRAHGIRTNEAEMMELCLSTVNGTSMLGTYRGLCLKTQGTPWRVRTFTGSYDTFRQQVGGPALLSVGLRRGAQLDPKYSKQWGWAPGVKHSVIYYGDSGEPGKVMMGDPIVGREQWFERGVRDLWYGEAMWLERR